MSTRNELRSKAEKALYETEHSLETKKGVVALLTVAARALIHDVDGFSVGKAGTLTYQSSIALRALEETH